MEGHVREHRGNIMEGHVHEHGPLYASVPCVMFDEGGWVGGSIGGRVKKLLRHLKYPRTPTHLAAT